MARKRCPLLHYAARNFMAFGQCKCICSCQWLSVWERRCYAVALTKGNMPWETGFWLLLVPGQLGHRSSGETCAIFVSGGTTPKIEEAFEYCRCWPVQYLASFDLDCVNSNCSKRIVNEMTNHSTMQTMEEVSFWCQPLSVPH